MRKIPKNGLKMFWRTDIDSFNLKLQGRFFSEERAMELLKIEKEWNTYNHQVPKGN